MWHLSEVLILTWLTEWHLSEVLILTWLTVWHLFEVLILTWLTVWHQSVELSVPNRGTGRSILGLYFNKT